MVYLKGLNGRSFRNRQLWDTILTHTPVNVLCHDYYCKYWWLRYL